MLALPNHSSLRHLTDVEDLNDWSARSEVGNRLIELGFKSAGSGSFSSVYKAPCGSRAVKLTRNDPGSLATLNAALAEPDNPHLPVIFGHVELDDGSLIVEVEFLEPVTCSEFDDWRSDFGMEYSRPDLDHIPAGPMRDAIAALDRHANDLIENGERIGWDDHSGNIMVRPSDGCIVLTDLLYDRNINGPSYGSEGSDF